MTLQEFKSDKKEFGVIHFEGVVVDHYVFILN